MALEDDERLASALRKDGASRAARAVATAQPSPPRRIGVGATLAILLAAHDTQTKVIVAVVVAFGAALILVSARTPNRPNDWLSGLLGLSDNQLSLLLGLFFIALVVSVAAWPRVRVLRALREGNRYAGQRPIHRETLGPPQGL